MYFTVFYLGFLTFVLCLTGCSRQQLATAEPVVFEAASDGFSKPNIPKTFSDLGERAYIGCWQGVKRGAIEFQAEAVLEFNDHPANTKKYSYVERNPVTQDYANNSFLIELNESPNLACFERVNLITVRNNEEIYITNYSSLDDYRSGNIVGHCSLVRMRCN